MTIKTGIAKFFGIGYKSQFRCKNNHTFDMFKYYSFDYVDTPICPICKTEEFSSEFVKK